MEMYNNEENKNMARDAYLSSEPPSLEHHPGVSRVRHLLVVLIGTDLILYVINFLFVIHSYASSESLESQSPNSSSQLSTIIIFLIYYGFGFLVVYRYYQTGLLVFTLLGPISLFLMVVILSSLIVQIYHTRKQMGQMTAGTVVAIIFVTLCLLASFLQIIFVGFAWKLYRLLKTNHGLTIEQI